jgi:hypothetical protein
MSLAWCFGFLSGPLTEGGDHENLPGLFRYKFELVRGPLHQLTGGIAPFELLLLLCP